MILGIHHVQITIPKDEEAAGRAFYCGLLNLIRIEEQIPIPGLHRFEFRDPFGNRVEMTQVILLD